MSEALMRRLARLETTAPALPGIAPALVAALETFPTAARAHVDALGIGPGLDGFAHALLRRADRDEMGDGDRRFLASLPAYPGGPVALLRLFVETIDKF